MSTSKKPKPTSPPPKKECEFAPLTKAEPWIFAAPDERRATVHHTLWFNARALALADLSRTAPPALRPLEPSDLKLVQSPHDPKPSGAPLSERTDGPAEGSAS